MDERGGGHAGAVGAARRVRGVPVELREGVAEARSAQSGGGGGMGVGDKDAVVVAGAEGGETRSNGHMTRGTPRFAVDLGERLPADFDLPAMTARQRRGATFDRSFADDADPTQDDGVNDPLDDALDDPQGSVRRDVGALESVLASMMPGSWLGKPLVAAVLTLATALIALIVLAQVSSFFATVERLPTLGRYLAYAAFGLICVAMVSAVGVLAWQYLKLRATPAVSLAGLRALSARAALQQDALHRSAAARRSLRDLLDRYPHDAAHQRRLRSLGAGNDEIKLILAARDDLLRRDTGSDVAFVEDFERRFVAVLDAVADRVVWRRTRRVAIQTAVIPTAFMDTLIVSANSYQLVGELARLYNLRAGPSGTAMILVHVVINAAVSSQVEDLTQDLSHRIFAGAGERLSGVLVGSAAARMGEGAANGLLVRRLGRLAVKRLRPLA